jgi:hypothetical protein
MIEVKLWDAETGQELLSFPGAQNTVGLAFAPDGQRLVGFAMGSKRKPMLWDARPVK